MKNSNNGFTSWLLRLARRRSPWFYVFNAGSCNGCDIEIGASLGPRYDPEQVGALRQGSPKHADILLVTGPVTLRSLHALEDIYAQIPFPKAVVAVGSCPASGNVFIGREVRRDGWAFRRPTAFARQRDNSHVAARLAVSRTHVVRCPARK